MKQYTEFQIPPFISDKKQSMPRKRLFIGLISGTATLLSLLLLIGWIIPYVGFANIHPAVPYISGCILLLLISLIAWSSIGLILQILTGKSLWGGKRIHGLIIKLFLPLMELLGRPFGISPQEVRSSFIKINNQLALQKKGLLHPKELLILVPHCLQQSDCTLRLTTTVDACKGCGKCPMAGLLQLSNAYGVSLAMATGGSIARRIVVTTKPRFIIAIACERDLATGIQDTHPLPVFGILNHRPEGPCYNTLVGLSLVETALRYFLHPEYTNEVALLYP